MTTTIARRSSALPARSASTADRVKVRKRFLGWPNFIFDTDSPFFGKSAGEVLALIVAGPDLEAGTSELALAFDNFWNNGEWQHGDVWTKLLQTHRHGLPRHAARRAGGLPARLPRGT